MLDGSAHIDAPGAPSLPIFLLCRSRLQRAADDGQAKTSWWYLLCHFSAWFALPLFIPERTPPPWVLVLSAYLSSHCTSHSQLLRDILFLSFCTPLWPNPFTASCSRSNDRTAMATSTPKSQDVQRQPIRYPLWFGGTASSCAAGVTHPLDLSTLHPAFSADAESITD